MKNTTDQHPVQTMPTMPKMPALIPTTHCKINLSYNLMDPEIKRQLEIVNHLQDVLEREQKKLVLLLRTFNERNEIGGVG
jgi:hypothetical protein